MKLQARMRNRLLVAAALSISMAAGCATSFTGDAHVVGGAAGCEVGRDGLLTFEGDAADTAAIAATVDSFGPGLRK